MPKGKRGPEWVDVARSKLLSHEVLAEDKRCYQNSFDSLLLGQDRDLLPEGTVYVEGWVHLEQFPIIPIHAWLEMPEGRLIEPTPRYLDDLEARTYYEVRRYTEDDVLGMIVAQGDDFLFPVTEEFRMESVPEDSLDLYYEIHERAWGEAATEMLKAVHAQHRARVG